MELKIINTEKLEEIRDILIEVDKIVASNSFADIERVKEIAYSLVLSGDIDLLYNQATVTEELLNENLLLYGRLNMISDIIEEGRNIGK